MAKRDYYEVLGVEKNASADEIKKAEQPWTGVSLTVEPTAWRNQRGNGHRW